MVQWSLHVRLRGVLRKSDFGVGKTAFDPERTLRHAAALDAPKGVEQSSQSRRTTSLATIRGYRRLRHPECGQAERGTYALGV